jgi:tetratricopeptide (TPR) repeat protein
MQKLSLTKPYIFLFILLVTAAVYGNTFLNQWTYDDLPVVVQNPDAHSISGFLENHRPGRPMRELTYIPEYRLFGSNPAGYHIQQLLWHAANGLLLFMLLAGLGIEAPFALFGVLLFLLHPLQAESVANISHRKELLAGFFCLASLLAYMKGVSATGVKRFWRLILCVLLYYAALLSNQTAITFPLLIILYELLWLKGDERLALRRPWLLASLLLIAGALVLIHYRSMFSRQALLAIYSKNGFIPADSYLPLYLADLKAFGLYFYKIILPVELAPEYVIQFAETPFQWLAWLSLALLGGGVAAAVLVRKQLPAVTFGIGWFLVMYLPVANLVPAGYMVADRYMYLCLPGVAMVSAALLQKYAGRKVMIAVGTLLVLLSVLTIVQNSYWRDEHSLWRHAARVNDNSTWAQESAALSYYLTGELDAALEHAQQALVLNRFNTRAYLTLAKIEEKRGEIAEAVQNYDMFVGVGATEYPAEAAAVMGRLPDLREQLQQKLKGKRE